MLYGIVMREFLIPFVHPFASAIKAQLKVRYALEAFVKSLDTLGDRMFSERNIRMGLEAFPLQF